MTNRIVNLEIPQNTHDEFEVTFGFGKIHTLVTSNGRMVKNWIMDIRRRHRGRMKGLLIGFEVLSRLSRSKTESEYPVATLQLCVGRRCLLFKLLHARKMPVSLIHFLKNDSLVFVGVRIYENAWKLYRSQRRLKVSNMKDLGILAKEKGMVQLVNAGPKRMSREILGRDVGKLHSKAWTRWDRKYLTPSQVRYASIRAFLACKIGRHLQMNGMQREERSS